MKGILSIFLGVFLFSTTSFSRGFLNEELMRIGGVEEFRPILQVLSKEEINSRDLFGRTPLHKLLNSSEREDGELAFITKLFLDSGADVNIPDDEGVTPLMTASGRGHEMVSQLLVFYGAHLEVRDVDGNTALFYVCSSRKPNTKVAKNLIQFGASTEVRNHLGENLAVAVAKSNQNMELIKLLFSTGADIFSKTPSGLEPKDFFERDSEEYKFLSSHQIYKEVGFLKNPLLSFSFTRGYVKEIMDKGYSSYTMKGYSVKSKNFMTGWSAIHILIRKNYDLPSIERIHRLLEEANGADDSGWTPLITASHFYKRTPDVIDFFMDRKGEGFKNSDKFGWTALFHAARFNPNKEVIFRIIEHNKKNGWVEEADIFGNYPKDYVRYNRVFNDGAPFLN